MRMLFTGHPMWRPLAHVLLEHLNTAPVTKAPDFRFQWVPHWIDFSGTPWFSSSEWKLDDPNSISETWHTHHLHFPSVKSRKEATLGTPASPSPEGSLQWTPEEVCLLAQAWKPLCRLIWVKLSKVCSQLFICTNFREIFFIYRLHSFTV